RKAGGSAPRQPEKQHARKRPRRAGEERKSEYFAAQPRAAQSPHRAPRMHRAPQMHGRRPETDPRQHERNNRRNPETFTGLPKAKQPESNESADTKLRHHEHEDQRPVEMLGVDTIGIDAAEIGRGIVRKRDARCRDAVFRGWKARRIRREK